jgi:hypothetical protein
VHKLCSTERTCISYIRDDPQSSLLVLSAVYALTLAVRPGFETGTY